MSSISQSGSARKNAPSGSEPSALADLLARVEKAEGPDRSIDAALFGLLECSRDNTDADLMRMVEAGEFDAMLSVFDESWVSNAVPCHYTASLDAALALCERVLDEAYLGLQQNRWGEGGGGGAANDHSWSAYVNTFAGWQNTDNNYEFTARSKSPALALLAAMLRALIAQAAGPAIGPLDRLDEDNSSSVAKSAPTQAGRASDAEVR